ncbi:uncharacterized protein CTRU02_204415 [Colletotrichum truncatum]|uniref:Uncharacterized protein n=1 Tax=Colletotrichum truncatum TaxID=5467 RepID=A0ACC3ZBZ8_COLTU|nr:uncharacterized protein CTRU02_14395 [Colletotrichum truncatum]KAF6782208.1 hypothetical protein CTRU02_14395 [Colletotrichum truncatum]
MKFFHLAGIALWAPSLTSAYLCTCVGIPERPISAAAGLCNDLKGKICYDKASNTNACIMTRKFTDQECATRYSKLVNGKLVPDTSFKAFCQLGTTC